MTPMAAHHLIAAFLSIVAGGAFGSQDRRISEPADLRGALAGVGYHAATGGPTTAAGVSPGWPPAAALLPLLRAGGLGRRRELVAALGPGGPARPSCGLLLQRHRERVLALLAAAHHGLLGATSAPLLLLTHWRVAGPGPLDGLT